MSRRKEPFHKERNGSFRVNLDEDMRMVLVRLTDELEQLDAAGETDDPRMRRLNPTAYHQDPEHDAEYQRLMADELKASRATSVATMREALGEELITESQLSAILRILNSLRLILGTQLDVSEDTELDLRSDHPLAGYHHLYEYLGYLLECAVREISR